MNRLRFLLLPLAIWAQEPAGKLPNGPLINGQLPKVILAQETPVELRLRETVSSADAEVNDRVEFEVAEDVRVNDHIVIPKGSYAWGVVTATARKSRMRRNGKLDIDLQAVCLPTGQPAPLRALRRGTQNPDGSEVAVSDSLFALPALPVMLFVWGKDVTIPAGREFTTFLAEDTVVSVDREREASKNCIVPEPPAPPPMLASERVQDELATVNVRSTPTNAEIYVDDKFMGNTPAVLKLRSGEHQIRLVMGGWSRWERTMAVTPGGDSNVQVTMESAVALQKEK